MGPIWPSYFEDCSSVIVCFPLLYCMYWLKKKYIPEASLTVCVHISTVHGGLSQHCSGIFVLYPATDCALSRAAAHRLCAYSVQQEVRLSFQTHIAISTSLCLDLHNTDIIFFPLCIIFLSLCINMVMFFTFFRDLPCTMSLVEMKSLIRMEEIIASAPQPITVLEVSAHSGQGLKEVLNWLESITIK